ncbi:MAG: thiamine-phosphate kinase [Pseudomonadota bacterium]
MALGEFDLIRRYFQHPLAQPGVHAGVRLGNGDDCALLQPSPGQVLAVSTDMLVAGRHFFPDVAPRALGHKALAVNLSDLAAMGARPLAFALALALPQIDEPWVQEFAAGLLALADAHGCALVGGDTCAGPLNVCITVFGELPPALALRRDAALAGDDLYVSGSLGQARLALEALRGRWRLPEAALVRCRQRLERPEPRLALGQGLRGLAHAAIDLSDGLLADLGHVLRASGVAAQLDVPALLASPAVGPDVRALALVQPALALTCLLAGGDDYELLCTAPVAARPALERLGRELGLELSRIGRIVAASDAGPQCSLVDARLQPYALPPGVELQGFDHFA